MPHEILDLPKRIKSTHKKLKYVAKYKIFLFIFKDNWVFKPKIKLCIVKFSK